MFNFDVNCLMFENKLIVGQTYPALNISVKMTESVVI